MNANADTDEVLGLPTTDTHEPRLSKWPPPPPPPLADVGVYIGDVEHDTCAFEEEATDGCDERRAWCEFQTLRAISTDSDSVLDERARYPLFRCAPQITHKTR